MSDTPAAAPPALAVHELSKTFGGVRALVGLDLEVRAGTVHALLGENGSGKSTLVKILAGFHRPDPGGSIRLAGHEMGGGDPGAAYSLGCRFVHQDLGLIDALSVADNLDLNAGFPTRLGTVRDKTARRQAAEDIARAGFEVDPRAIVAMLSPAERAGVAIARALKSDAANPVRLLVLDEPTATLPQAEAERLLTMVRSLTQQGIAVLYVSHRLEEIFALDATVTVLRDGRKVASVESRDITRTELVSMLIGRELVAEKPRSATPQTTSRRPPMLTVRGLSAEFVGGIDLDVRPGEIVGIAGIMGSGRETLLPAVFGAVPRTGEVSVAGRTVPAGRPRATIAQGVAYVPPDRKVLGGFLELSARENLGVTGFGGHRRWGSISTRRERATSVRWMTDLGVRPLAPDKQLVEYSGGNQQKVLMAKWLRHSPRVLLVDEPTQGIDVGAKAALHRVLIDLADTADAAIVFSSSDIEELLSLSNRIVVLYGGQVVAQLTGSEITHRAVSAACMGGAPAGATR